MVMEKMTSGFRGFIHNVNVGQFCINFMRIVTRKRANIDPVADGAQAQHEDDGTPQWRYSVQYHLGDPYTGEYHTQTGVIVERNYFRAITTATRLIQAEHPDADSILITEFARINKPAKKNKKQRSQPTGHGYLYLLEGKPGEYKIGLSAKPQRRVSTLGVQLPFAIDVIHLIEVDNMLAAEQMLHKQFASKRINGEWFTLSADDVAAIKAITRISEEVGS